MKNMSLQTMAVWMIGLMALDAILAPIAFATQGLEVVSNNIVDSVGSTPLLFAAAAYISGGFFAVSALFKLKDHVDNPAKTQLKDVIIRFVAAAMLLALPTVIDAIWSAIGYFGRGASFNEIEGGLRQFRE